MSCADLDRCRYVACKIHQLHAMWGEEKKSNYIKHATREYNIQRTLNHPRLVGLLDVFEIDVNSFCTGSAPPPPHSPRRNSLPGSAVCWPGEG